jgi:hypothetical protein
MKKITLLLHIFLTTVMLQAQNTTLPVGAIPGVIDVSPMGAATYTIPIEVVPGTQGMQPNLSIVYNSMSGMGALGMKWSLAGLSAITLCGQTPYYDNNITAIDFSNANILFWLNNRFALDGNRLVILNDDIYGTVGGEYATETENFTRIVSNDGSAGFPISFTAYTDDGTIIEYGHTHNSRQIVDSIIAASPTKFILSWYVNKITDANGNYMTFHYEKSNREVWIKEIHYTGNDGDNGNGAIQPYAKIEFDYTTNILNPNTIYVSRYGIPQTKLLTSILVRYNNNTVAREYTFDYNIYDPEERTAHLKEITLYEAGEDGGHRHLNPTIINWGTQSNAIETTPPLSFSSGSIVTGDFNGDGYTDYVVYNQGSGLSRSFQLYYNNRENNFNSAGNPGSGTSLKSYAYSYDIKGEGRDALILAEDHNTTDKWFSINIYSWENNQFQKLTALSQNIYYFVQAHFGDFNGDGKVNIMYESRKIDKTGTKYTLSFSNNNGFSCSDLTFYNVDDIRIMDYNGNGKANIEVTKGSNTVIYEYSATQHKFNLAFTAGFPTNSDYVYHGDFNGDGITDIIYYNNYSWVIRFGLGDFYESKYYTEGIPLHYLNAARNFPENGPKYPIFIADLNGDGKDDIIQPVYLSNFFKTQFKILYSKGYMGEEYDFTYKFWEIMPYDYSNFGNLVSGNLWHVGDFNGDGKNDLLLKKNNSDAQPIIVYVHKNEQYEYVKTITNGLGKKDSISYTPTYLPFRTTSLGYGNKAFLQLPTEVQSSNGIGNGMNKLEFSFLNPIYGAKRRTFLGFWDFITKSIDGNMITTDTLYFHPEDYPNHLTNGLEMLLPYQKIHAKTHSPYTINKIEYTYQRVPLPYQRFIIHNYFTRDQDNLSDTKAEITTTLDNGRLATSVTKTFNTSNVNATIWLHSETNNYFYNTITLNDNHKKPFPLRFLLRNNTQIVIP